MHPDNVMPGLSNWTSYDIMQSIGFVLAASYCLFAGLKLGIRKSQLIIAIAIGFFTQLFGGMAIPLIYKIFVLHVPAYQLHGSCPGRYFHSAFLSILIYALLVAKFFKWPVKKILDELMIAVMIMSSVGRIGCSLIGCCEGKPIPLPGTTFNPDLTTYPVQIYMFLCELLILGILVWINRNKKYDGRTFWYGIFLYSLYRFFIEFLRTNPVFILGLSHAQCFSIITLCISAAYLLYKKFCAFFLRDPERSIPFSDNSILSPADGRITEISPGKISIYLSFFDIHVNRSPISGVVKSILYSRGKFRFAFDRKAAEENENNLIRIVNGDTEVAVRQIAGKFARRIVCYCKEGEALKQGDRIGMIRFGSSVQVYLPAKAAIQVKPGDKVRAGQTVLSTLRH